MPYVVVIFMFIDMRRILFYDLHFVCLQHPILLPTFCLFTAAYFITYILFVYSILFYDLHFVCLQHPIL
jgi:hypothetical protein